jgi:sucrose-6-phosphate hydrolase SacC (GH32 family)
MGWMSNWQYAAKLPTSPWRGQMSLPRQLSLLKDEAGLALIQEPVIAPLRTDHAKIPMTREGDIASKREAPFDLDLDFGHPSDAIFGLRIYSDDRHWSEIGFDQLRKEFYIDRIKSGTAITPDFPTRTIAPLIASRPFDLKLIVDRSSIEAYAQSGMIAMTDLIFPVSSSSWIAVFSSSGKPISVKGDLWKLSSVWK